VFFFFFLKSKSSRSLHVCLIESSAFNLVVSTLPFPPRRRKTKQVKTESQLNDRLLTVSAAATATAAQEEARNKTN